MNHNEGWSVVFSFSPQIKVFIGSKRSFLSCKPGTWMSPLWGPLCPYIHSTVAFEFSHMWIRKSGRLLIGSSTRGSWGGKYIQPMMKSPSTWMKHSLLLSPSQKILKFPFVTFVLISLIKRRATNCAHPFCYLPQHWAIHRKALCQAATNPKCVCMDEALQHISIAWSHTDQFLQWAT